MTVYNINLGIGWASSGVEYAQAYRSTIFKNTGIKAKFVFMDMFLQDNLSDLTRQLTKFGGNIQCSEVPFSEIQEEIKEKAPEAYLMTLTRRFMMRITDRIREERRGLVIINGESLGQVASQTMESMQAINAVTCTPVIRPVVTMDKLEIIDLAQKIDTFDISIQPFEDCCTIFAPDRPKTNPKIKNVEQYERRMDVDALVERAVAGIMVTEITPIEEAQDEVDTLIEDLL